MGKVEVQMGIIELALAIALGIILARIVLKIFNVFIHLLRHLSSGAIAFLIVVASFLLLCLYLIPGEALENEDAGSVVGGIALIAAFASIPLGLIWYILTGVIEGYREG